MTELTEAQKKAQALEVVVDVENHHHGGKAIKKGEKIKVTQSEYDWLVEQKIIKAKG